MKVPGLNREFIVIGENIHTTRILLRTGRRVTADRTGHEAIQYSTEAGETRYLKIPDEAKRTQDYEEGRVKHVKIAIQAAMSGRDVDATEGTEYLRHLVKRQAGAGCEFLDLNVDEISLRPAEQQSAMQWLVRTVEEMSTIPVSIDSSNIETIQAGLAVCQRLSGRALLNSASLERLDALELAKRYDAQVVVTAAGEKGMPQNDVERVDNATRMVDAALSKGIAIEDIYVDALVFPISVDSQYGIHCFEAIRKLRARYGPQIHITGGLSNVSFGLPARRLINDVFTVLAVGEGADSGIIDPVASNIANIFSMDRQGQPYRLAEDLLLGRDHNCKNFLRAYRKGELQAR